MTYDPSNRKQVRSKEKEAALADANRIAYTRRIMSDQPGREWMHQLLDCCYIFGEPFVRGAPDATGHNLGRQAVGKQIFADIVNNCPTEYIIMMQEANVKDQVHERRYSDNRDTDPGQLNGSSDLGRDTSGPEPGDYDPFATDGTER